jgi:M6 family metalloprotease-like protein/uncharacterized repeat protein (TIGR02543 family)
MKKIKRILALALCFMLLLSAASVVFAAEAGTSSGRVIDGYEPIPLVVIKVNFETDGDGKDCYYEKDKNGESLGFDRFMFKNSAQWGEQYCYSPDSYWSEMCFGEGFGSLNDYYKYISNDRFYWIPAEETSGTANDGVITVTVNAKHPGADDKEGLHDSGERGKIIEAADEFIDFSKYDKDGSGQLDFTELSVVFIYSGMEISYGSPTSMLYSYATHAHVSHMSYTAKLDGVKLWGDLPYVRMGESSNGSGGWSKMGKLAHELGHVLGAKDLYMSDGRTWIGGCGQLSLMGGGSGGMNGGISSPTVLDPYYKVLYGFADEIVAKSGVQEYTLYSHESKEGEFNVIRVNTLNPREYYLIENRTHSIDGYDNNGLNGDMQGILIWHIDERIVNGYSRPNNGGENHAAGFTIISPTNVIQDVDESSTWSSISASNVFVANSTAQYKFPVGDPAKNPGTWYTAMTEEQAAQLDIKIEFLTEPGDEMKVRISGAIDQQAEFSAGVGEKAQTSMTISANIRDFNGATVTSCKVKFADNKQMENARELDAAKSHTARYSATFDGLTPSTQYFYEVELTTTHGTSTVSGSALTAAVPVEDTTAKVTLVINSDNYQKTTQNVKKGNTLRINFPLTKSGYTFDGWYLDEACTVAFDVTKPIESADDFTIYAKWTAEVTTPTTATTAATTEATTGEMPNEPVSGGCGGSAAKGAEPMLFGGAVIAILGAAASGKCFGRKKSDSEE